MYNKELSHARRALDETTKDMAKFEIEAERHKTNNMELHTKAEAETQLADSKKKAEDATADKNKLSEELKTISQTTIRCIKMHNELTNAKKNLEGETLKQINLQNNLQTIQEEHKFENDQDRGSGRPGVRAVRAEAAVVPGAAGDQDRPGHVDRGRGGRATGAELHYLDINSLLSQMESIGFDN
jgi:chromosome segregation ATPase